MNYNIVKKIFLYLGIATFISIYLSLVFSSIVTYISPKVHLESPIYTWRIPDAVIEEIIRNYVQRKTELELRADAEMESQKALEEARQRMSEARDYAAKTPFEQRLPKKDMEREYQIYNVSILFNPKANMDNTQYIIGPDSALKEKYINVRDTVVYIGNSEGTSQKIGACIRYWKKTLVFNVVLVNNISRRFNAE